jgi:hypothetical protein
LRLCGTNNRRGAKGETKTPAAANLSSYGGTAGHRRPLSAVPSFTQTAINWRGGEFSPPACFTGFRFRAIIGGDYTGINYGHDVARQKVCRVLRRPDGLNFKTSGNNLKNRRAGASGARSRFLTWQLS